LAQNYDKAAAEGNKYVGGELSLHDAAAPLVEGDKAVLSFLLRREPVSLVDGNGGVLESRTDPAPDLSSGVTLSWSTKDRAWSVTAFSIG
jgi:hypothetical protein